jgi:hypothetical protein
MLGPRAVGSLNVARRRAIFYEIQEKKMNHAQALLSAIRKIRREIFFQAKEPDSSKTPAIIISPCSSSLLE